jgi:hypothetical protein
MSDNFIARNSYYTAMLDNITEQLGLDLDDTLSICTNEVELAYLSQLNNYLSVAVSEEPAQKRAWLHLHNYDLVGKPIDIIQHEPEGLALVVSFFKLLERQNGTIIPLS